METKADDRARVWLHAEDGRQLYLVWIQTPAPKAVTYDGRVFSWSSKHGQYREVQLFKVVDPIEMSQAADAVADNVEPPDF